MRLPEAVWVCLGALVLILLHLISWDHPLLAVSKGVDVYLFLAGMMLLAELARREGVFDWLAGALGGDLSGAFGVALISNLMNNLPVGAYWRQRASRRPHSSLHEKCFPDWCGSWTQSLRHRIVGEHSLATCIAQGRVSCHSLDVSENWCSGHAPRLDRSSGRLNVMFVSALAGSLYAVFSYSSKTA